MPRSARRSTRRCASGRLAAEWTRFRTSTDSIAGDHTSSLMPERLDTCSRRARHDVRRDERRSCPIAELHVVRCRARTPAARSCCRWPPSRAASRSDVAHVVAALLVGGDAQPTASSRRASHEARTPTLQTSDLRFCSPMRRFAAPASDSSKPFTSTFCGGDARPAGPMVKRAEREVVAGGEVRRRVAALGARARPRASPAQGDVALACCRTRCRRARRTPVP